MKTFPHLVVCEYCDCVYQRRELSSSEVARCWRWSAALYRGSVLDFGRWLALTITPAIAFVIANVSQILLISFHGVHNEATSGMQPLRWLLMSPIPSRC